MVNIRFFVAIPSIGGIGFHTSAFVTGKNMNRQVKILGKLFGEKVSGSKKRWYPSVDIFQNTKNLIKTKAPGKNSARRITVLNKLFMRHVTDLLATGEVSEDILGKGLEISKVKITSDFHGVNVYWIAKGDISDSKIEAALNTSSGALRHELSQLRLMGEVPKIRFVKDKFYANLAEVECILRKCDFGDEHEGIDTSQIIRNFVGYSDKNALPQSEDDDEHEPLPPMRYDILGLNHKGIMEKINAKMKKSKLAWAAHDSNIQTSRHEVDKTNVIEDHKNKLEEIKLDEIELEKFLKRKKYAKNTLARKKDLKLYEDYMSDIREKDVVHESFKDEGDYIEEYEKDKF